MNDLIRTSGLKECAMQWLHCVSAYFRGRPIFLVFSNIFRLIFESAYFRGNTVNKFIEMVICVAVDSKSVDKGRPTFL